MMKMKQTTLLTLLLALTATALHAKLPEKKGLEGLKRGDKAPAVTVGSAVVKSKETKSKQIKAVDCNKETDQTMPLSLLFSRVAYHDEIKVVFDEKSSMINITIPDIIGSCLSLNAKAHQLNGKVAIEFVNDHPLEGEGTMVEKYNKCLKAEGVLSENEEELYFDKKPLTTSTFSIPLPENTPLDKKLELVYASPISSGFGQFFEGKVVKEGCYAYEPAASEGVYLVSDDEADLRHKLKEMENCEHCSKAREELENILKQRDAQGKIVKTQEAISRAVDALHKKELDELLDKIGKKNSEIREADDREMLRTLGSEYIKLINELKTKGIDRNLAEIDRLTEEMRTDPKKKSDNQKKIRDLQREIAGFNKVVQKGVEEKLVKFAVTEHASDVRKFRLTAERFSIYPKKKKEILNKQIDREMEQFGRDMELVEMKYEAKEGYAEHSPEMRLRYSQAEKRKSERQTDLMSEYKKGMEACQPYFFSQRNPAYCQYWQRQMPEWQSGYQREMSSYDRELNLYKGLYYEMSQYEYEARNQRDRDLGDGYDRNFFGPSPSLFNDGRYDPFDNYNFNWQYQQNSGRYPATSPMDQYNMMQGPQQPLFHPQDRPMRYP